MKTNRKRSVIENGVRIISERLSFSRSVSIGIWINIGSRDDPIGKEGISHFIEHMLFKGTKKRSALDIAKEFDQMGGFSNAFTSKEITCFHAKVLKDNLKDIIELLADIILNSTFNPLELYKEKEVILQELSMVEDCPDEYIHEIFPRFYWPNHGLGHSILGTKESISSITNESLKQFIWDSYRGSRIIVAAAGDIEHSYLVELINKTFSKIPKGSGPKRKPAPPPKIGIKICHKDLEQAHFILGGYAPTAGDIDKLLYSVFNVILGSSMSSRLFQEIREKRGLSYSIYSFTSHYEDTGMLGIYGACAPKKLCEIIRLIIAELAQIAQHGIKENELSSAIKYLKSAILLSCENIDSRMSRLAKHEIYLKKFLTPQEVIKKIETITLEDIKKVAQDTLSKGFSLVTLGPINEKQLRDCYQIIGYQETKWGQNQNDMQKIKYWESKGSSIKII